MTRTIAIFLLIVFINLTACRLNNEVTEPTQEYPQLAENETVTTSNIAVTAIYSEGNSQVTLTPTVKLEPSTAVPSISTATPISDTSSTSNLLSCLPPKELPQIVRRTRVEHLVSAAEASDQLPTEGLMVGPQLSYDHQKLIFGWYEEPAAPGGDLMVYNNTDNTVKTILELNGESGLVSHNVSPVSDCILVTAFLEEDPDAPYLMLDSQGKQYPFRQDVPGLAPNLIKGRAYFWALDGVQLAMLVVSSLKPNSSYNDPTLSSLYILQVDGTVIKTLYSEIPEEEFELSNVAWSPDSKKIAGIATYRGEDGKFLTDVLMIIDVETSERTWMPLGKKLSFIIWSSDGEAIYHKASELCHLLKLATGEIISVDGELCNPPSPPGLNP